MQVLVAAIAVYGLLVAALYLGQRNLIYFPSSAHLDPRSFGVPEFEVVRLETGDGLPLAAWWHPPRDGNWTLVLFHGNAGHIGHRANKFAPFLREGRGVLLVEYRGYGPNPGYPTEQGLYADADAAMSFVSRRGIEPRRIVLYGESLGTGVAVETAVRHSVGALVLEAPFTSIPDMAQLRLPFVPARWLAKDRFDSASKIGGLRVPVMVIHGGRDGTIPIRVGRRLFDLISAEKEFVHLPAAGHNDLFDFGARERAADFIDRVIGDGGETSGSSQVTN